MAEDGLLKYTRELLVYDAVNTMFRSYINALHYDVSEEKLKELIDKYLDMYQDYVIQSFEELNMQTIESNNKQFIMIDELMAKVTNIVAAKLVAELLLVELRKEIQ